MGSRSLAATASAAACAPLIVVMQGTRYCTALRRMAFSSWNAGRAGGRVDRELDLAGLEQIDRVGAAFVHFEHRLAGQLRRAQNGGAFRAWPPVENPSSAKRCATFTASCLC